MKSSGCLRSDGGDEPPPSIEEPALDLDLLAAAAAASGEGECEGAGERLSVALSVGAAVTREVGGGEGDARAVGGAERVRGSFEVAAGEALARGERDSEAVTEPPPRAPPVELKTGSSGVVESSGVAVREGRAEAEAPLGERLGAPRVTVRGAVAEPPRS